MYALDYSTFKWVAAETLDNYVISVGFVICVVICIPFGYLNLDDNMWFQWFSFFGLVIFTLEFLVQFSLNITPGTHFYNATNGPKLTPAFKSSGQAQVLGIAVFAYAYIVTIPSWVNEKKPSVGINRAVWIPATIGLFMKVSVGLLGAWAYVLTENGLAINPNYENVLNILSNPKQAGIVTQISAYAWNFSTLIPGIPILAIMVKYNLLSGKLCGEKWSFFWGVVFPWIVTAFCYEQKALQTICTWAGILVQGFINFVAPALLYRKALIMYPDGHMGINTDAAPIERPVNAVPAWLTKRPKRLAEFIAIFFCTLALGCIIFNFYVVVKYGCWDPSYCPSMGS